MSGRTSRRLLAVIVFVLLPSFAAEEVRACDCLFGGSAVCQEFWEMDVVFAGTVVGTSEIATEPANYKRRLVRFSVEQSYRGGAGAFVEVVTGRGGGDCGYGFKQGGQYLVYARRNEHDRKLYTGICTRTRRLAEADADLAFFRGLATAEAAGSVFGTVVKRNYEWKEGEEPFKPVANAELSVEGETARYELKSDAEGNFRFERLAPGTYKVKLRLPPGLTYGEEDETTRTVGYDVEVSARGCAEADFHLVADGRVGGHVVDASARPAANLRLEMRGATSDARNVNTFLYTDTNAEGAFEFKRVPPGDYWFGVRLLSSSGGEIAPYPRTYFPGVTARAQASVVSLKEGERRSGLEFRLTPRLAEYGVEGFVVWADGRPAPGVNVYLSLVEEGQLSAFKVVRADERGRFALKVYEGLSYQVSAYPQGAQGAAAQSRWADVPPNSGAGQQPIKLVLPLVKDDKPQSGKP